LLTENASDRPCKWPKQLDEAIQILIDAGDTGSLAWGYWSKANHCQLVGQHENASLLYKKAFRFAAEARCADAARYAIAGKTEIDRILGHYGSAIPMHVKARELFRSVSDYRGVVWADEGLAQMALRLGRLPDAHKHFARALSNASLIGDSRGAAWAKRGLAEVAYRSHDLIGARFLAVQAFDDFKLCGVLVGAGYAKLTMARVSHVEQDHWAASAEISDAESIFLRTGHKRGLFWSKQVACFGLSHGKELPTT
jgi:tetratricopeptide (TPR) repeat protein